mgnify:CR=1 FL=1
MPTLQQFRYFVAVAETLHFRRAAELSHVTQPTLSGQLRELELNSAFSSLSGVGPG